MMKSGSLAVIIGPMFCGKSGEISRRLRRDSIAGRVFTVIKPEIDNRYDQDSYRDRNNAFSCPAINAPVEEPSEAELSLLLSLVADSEVIAIDEVQFFDRWITSFVLDLRRMGKKVYVAGLDTDYMNEPFGFIGDLCCYADEILKLKAVCIRCGEDATQTQRLINGMPAPLGDKVVIGDKDRNAVSISYEARCANDYVHPSEAKVFS